MQQKCLEPVGSRLMVLHVLVVLASTVRLLTQLLAAMCVSQQPGHYILVKDKVVVRGRQWDEWGNFWVGSEAEWMKRDWDLVT